MILKKYQTESNPLKALLLKYNGDVAVLKSGYLMYKKRKEIQYRHFNNDYKTYLRLIKKQIGSSNIGNKGNKEVSIEDFDDIVVEKEERMDKDVHDDIKDSYCYESLSDYQSFSNNSNELNDRDDNNYDESQYEGHSDYQSFSNNSTEWNHDYNDYNQGDDNYSSSNHTNQLDDISMDSNDEINQRKCSNCKRLQSHYLIQQYGTTYRIEFTSVYKHHVKTRRKFKFLIDDDFHNNRCTVCVQCCKYLTLEDNKCANSPSNTWPSFIWYMLSSNDIRKYYHIVYVWGFIPTTWRYWWIESLEFASMNMTLSIDSPKPFFADKTKDIIKWDQEISSYSLPRLRDICNELMIPCVLCPFGCSTFIHRHGSMSYDIIVQRYLQRVILRKMYSNSNGFKYALSTREDYIRPKFDYDNWLLNPLWTIYPSITFVNNVPVVMTCPNHDKGTTLLMIHPPRSPSTHTLSSSYSDQLAYCAIRTRTIKPMQKKYYSTSYQMHEQRGSFNGIDTCNITTFRKFDFNSKLLSTLESYYIRNRPDVNSLLDQLIREKRLSSFVADSKRVFACNTCKNINFETYLYGATYVPFIAAMSMHKELTNNIVLDVELESG